MGTKTVDETGADTGTKAKTDDEKVDTVGTTDAGAAGEATEHDDAEAGDEVTAQATEEGPSGVGQGAGAVVSAALGLVSLTGSWVGTIATARENLLGQLENSSNSNVDKLIQEGYVDGWHAAALWGGLFALAGLLVGVFVLIRPAFGAPGKPQAVWIKAVAWGGVTLGVIGLLLAVLKYTDVLLGIPSVG
ncbi:hypothetical protein ACFYNL_12735 [Streptomyces sp. NPDC007808]|uniref:hypothetical protein n=1 Tax=Streptomyces sp. NPDC007808 TaxID=3364779 RepID=UPI0036B36479